MEEEKVGSVEKMHDRSLEEGSSKGDDLVLPGFRFHPTDEELVGFYLRRKVERKPLSIEIIKHIDIYKYDPWDLPRVSIGVAEEWYFFCQRGRKYRNSIRPNRVTGSGFWKATGIDRPIYSSSGNCIGLKKSLVYYMGSAGKGMKTDWMMHEFRHPPKGSSKNGEDDGVADDASLQEAEIWTICRIFKKSTPTKKYMQALKQASIIEDQCPPIDSSSKSCSMDSEIDYEHKQFAPYKQDQSYMLHHASQCYPNNMHNDAINLATSVTCGFACPSTVEDASWEELGRMMELAQETSLVYGGRYA